MAYSWAKLVLLTTASFACCGQISAQSQESTNNPPVLPTLSAPVPPPPIVIVPRPPLPSPPDAPIPDLGTLPSAPDKSKSRARHAIDRLAPRCLDTVFHTCWSSPPGDGPVNVSETDREFAKDLEAGDFYLKGKNYRAAELRFREALNYKPDHPEATFKLAESLDKLRKNDEARDMYQTYLKILPNGPFAEQARKALQRLEKQLGPEKLASRI